MNTSKMLSDSYQMSGGHQKLDRFCNRREDQQELKHRIVMIVDEYWKF